jgi:hypothetical protein
MEKKIIIQQLKEIKRLKEVRGEPFKTAKLNFLKNEVLKKVGEEIVKVGSYVLQKGYVNKDTDRPYLQIYSKKTWKIHEDWLKNNQQKI